MGIDPQDAADPSKRSAQRAVPGPGPSADEVGAHGVSTIAGARSAMSPARTPSRFLRCVVVLMAVAAVLVVLITVAVTVPFTKGSSASGAHLATAPHASATPARRSTAPASASIAHDGGSREYAKGRAARVGNGVFRYTVAPGDTFLGIASRFHVCVADIDSGRPRPDWGSPLTAGTRIRVELGTWPTKADGTVDCIWDH
ncbi:LysM peptidoglycan-binding domain-containing protein [Amnibacterium sp.]|uniref:LysM peptidoglycan-binding domain-containing protein n=1 Tax=Amnibacterium sp. TaxID=1872496 RepID=UPI003F7CD33D